MTTIDRQAAAQEVLNRLKIQQDLVAWAEYFGQDRGWKPAAHHRLLLEILQKVTDGKLIHSETGLPVRNVIVLMPPGSAKSSYTSIVFPIWFIQRRENCRILACSHSADLIESFSRECRNGVEAHKRIIGYSLQADSRAVQEWSTTNSGSYRCAGVGAGLAGRRADAGVIDDYIGSQEDADSKLIRDKQWAWYLNDFWPRLKPNAIQIIVANRRHEDDLVGRLLDKEGDKWETIKIPFFAEENDVLGRQLGERLWPEWFDEAMAEQIKTLPPRTIAGLYQQRPAPEEGDYFKAEWLLEYDREEYQALERKNLRVYGAGDWAVSEEKDSNRTCFGGAVLDENKILYILPDLFWKIAGPKEVVGSFLDFLKRRTPMQTWSEKGHISKAWGPFLKEMMIDDDVYSYITEVTPARAKDVRARSIQGRMSMGRVKFPSFASWWPQARHELLMFPGGKTDDFVDFIAHIGMGINNMVKASPIKKVERFDLRNPIPITLEWIKKHDATEKQKREIRYAGR